ncbi:hypothetical protein [Nocardia camponoti]|nr:hypothetical protein [Nocardia camponoti]
MDTGSAALLTALANMISNGSSLAVNPGGTIPAPAPAPVPAV